MISVGPLEALVAMPEELFDRVSGSPAYRLVSSAAGQVAGILRSLRADEAVSPTRASTARHTPTPEDLDPGARPILDRVAEIDWYHTIQLGHGVVTPGLVDYRPHIDCYALPESLAGMRALDVGTFDGFWAFEMERRGADEVVALDTGHLLDIDGGKSSRDWSAGFSLAHEILRSRVRRDICDLSDLAPERFGKFDLVLISDLLNHIRDPQLALERVWSVCRGMVVVAERYDPTLDAFGDRALARYAASEHRGTWWVANTATLRTMMELAGFAPTIPLSRFVLSPSDGQPTPQAVLHGSVRGRARKPDR
jgi:tRNA (mo5U34)-methyltransferase